MLQPHLAKKVVAYMVDAAFARRNAHIDEIVLAELALLVEYVRLKKSERKLHRLLERDGRARR